MHPNRSARLNSKRGQICPSFVPVDIYIILMKKHLINGKNGCIIECGKKMIGEDIMSKLKKYMQSLLIWVLIAALTGIVTGVVGAVFHKAIEFATQTRNAHDSLIYLLPVGGAVIFAMYNFSKVSLTTNTVFECVRERKKVPVLLAPFIFIGAFITHLLGGSAGREGAALQIGGGVACYIGRALKLKKEDMSTIIICGMSGAFSAIFTTPITAAVFAYEVVSVGKSRYYEFLPSVVSAVFGYIVTVMMGNETLAFTIKTMQPTDLLLFGKIAVLALMTGLLSIVFCVSLKKGEHYFKKFVPNGYLRGILGGAVVLFLTLIVGCRDYNGAGMNIISQAIGGQVKYEAFILKLIFTVVTISAGFKGGEIVPAFFIGATFGAAASVVLGMDMGFCAAIGMCAMFCGITNCPVASIFLGAELFGADNILFFALACAVSYVASGYFGLYGSQKIVYSKVSFEKLNVFTK